MIARIEKVLDGQEYTSSIKPYADQTGSFSKNNKKALRLNKKMKALCTTKLGLYKMPFAWGVKPIYKKFIVNTAQSSNHGSSKFRYDLNDSEFLIYQQDMTSLSDEDLYKYLSDFYSKEKYFYNKLIQMNVKLDVKLTDLKASNSAYWTSNSFPIFNSIVSYSY